MIRIKQMKECTFDQVLTTWNEGFEGYEVNMKMDLNRFLNRLTQDGLSVDHSFVAFKEDKPVGLVLHGVKKWNGKQVVWNGGTGIIPSERGKGVGVRLIDHAFSYYKQLGIDVALLEAIATNERAIKLYEKMGYSIIDRVAFLKANSLEEDVLLESEHLQVEELHASKVQALPFYSWGIPWQNDFDRVPFGQSFIISEAEKPVAYGLVRQTFDDNGNVNGIYLYQFEVAKEKATDKVFISQALNKILHPSYENCLRTVINFSTKNPLIMDTFKEAGFEIILEQVSMRKEM